MPFIQARTAFNDFGTSVGVAFSSNNTAGSCLFAGVGNDTAIVPTVSDTRNGAWAANNVTVENAGVKASLFSKPNCGAGSNTVTASFGATNVGSSLCLEERSGLAAVSPLDKTATGTGFGTAATTSATAATAQADEVLIVVTCRETVNSLTFTPGTNYTERAEVGAGVRPSHLEEWVVAAISTYAGAATLDVGAENWAQVLGTYKIQPSLYVGAVPIFLYPGEA
jgi:hypothetical protein